MQRLMQKDLPIRPGMRIAITGGSQGIADYRLLMKTTVEHVCSKGGEPFIVLSMGSHDRGIAEGQRDLLHSLGISGRTGQDVSYRAC